MKTIKLSQLIADLEKTTDEAKRELGEMKATMLVNFGLKNKNMPELLDGSEKTALQMFIKIMEFYHPGN